MTTNKLDETPYQERLLACEATPLLFNNHPPADADIPLFQAHIASLSESISSAELELRHLQSKVDLMHQRRTNFQSILSPIRRLPPELVSELLKTCLGLSSKHGMDRSQRRSFMILRSVCQQWRGVAFASPELWAGLHIELHDLALDLNPLEDSISNRIRPWFDRAGDMPLSLSFNIERDHSKPKLAEELKRISLIAAEDRCWGHLVLVHPGLNLRDMFLALQRASYLPWRRLRSLAFISPSISYGLEHVQRQLKLVMLGGALPALCHLGLEIQDPIFDATFLSHPGVRTLRLSLTPESDPFESTICILSAFPDVRDAVVLQGVTTPVESRPQRTLPFVHHGMQKIVLHNSAVDSLGKITLPNLQHLEIICNMSNNAAGADLASSNLISFLARSACPLRILHLELRGGGGFGTPLDRMLQAVSDFQTLESLSIYTPFFVQHLTAEFLDHGQSPETQPSAPLVFPSIQRIAVLGKQPYFDPNAFIRYLENRRNILLELQAHSPQAFPPTKQNARKPILLELEACIIPKIRLACNRDRDASKFARILELGVQVSVAGTRWN